MEKVQKMPIKTIFVQAVLAVHVKYFKLARQAFSNYVFTIAIIFAHFFPVQHNV